MNANKRELDLYSLDRGFGTMSSTRVVNALRTIGHCYWLLGSLLALLCLYPYLGGDGDEVSFLLEVLISAVLLTGVFAFSRRVWQLWLALALLAPALAGNWLGVRADQSLPALLMVLSEAAFFALVTAGLFVYVMRGVAPVAERLAGALSVYLMLGVGFSMVYDLVETLVPGNFNASDAPQWEQLLYFSFVTLTTLGYGDLTPVTTQAQSIVIVETTIGVIYMAVLVAWLVSSLRSPA